MFIGDLLWILESPEAKSHAWGCVGLDPRTGGGEEDASGEPHALLSAGGHVPLPD